MINYNKGMKLLLLINFLLLFILLNDNSINRLMNEDIKNVTIGINITLSIISMVVNYIYYKLYKRWELLILALINAVYNITCLLNTVVLHFINTTYEINSGNLVITLIINSFLILLFTVKDSKVKKWIEINESKAIILVILLHTIFSVIELTLLGSGLTTMHFHFVNFAKLFVILAHIYSFIYLYKMAIKNNDYILGVVALTINLFLFLHFISFSRDLFLGANIEILEIFLYCIVNLLPCMLFVYEFVHKSRREKVLEWNLDVFYNIAENHENSSIIITDFENKILYCNKKFENSIKAKEYSDVEFNTVNFYEFARIALVDYEILHNEIETSLLKNNSYKGVIKTFKGGYYDLYVQNIKDNNSNSFVLAVMTNITAEYKNVEKLRINQEKLTTINRNIKDFIIMLDNKLNVTYVNPRFMNRLGYNLNEIIGYPSSKFCNKSIKRDEITINSNEIMTRRTLICKNSKSFEIETIETKIHENGKTSGFIIVGRELGFINEYSALIEKYKEIQEYDKIREEFFANLSHEVRTPINVIYSSLQLLNQKRSYCDENEFLNFFDKYEDNMKVNCLRLLRLVNNILALTKVNSGSYNITYQTIEGINFLEDIIESVVPFAESKGITLIFDTNIEEKYISIEPFAIEKVILNLLSNSIKYTKKGGEIFVECYASKEWFNITIRDNGVGIPRAMRKIVFERFAQVNKSFNRESEGSGIGLALVKSLVELHNGRIFINDTSVGTSITIKLPTKKIDCAIINTQSTSNIKEKVKIELSDIYL